MKSRRWGFVIVAVLASACGSSPTGDDGGANATHDGGGGGGIPQDQIVARIAAFDTSGDFTQVNATPFVSQHASAAAVNVWASSEALDTYTGIDPTDTSATVDSFPAGSILIKEMLDASGTRTGLTAMAKGGEGGSPDAGNWWWGRLDASGALVQGGTISFCIDCHGNASNMLQRTDWVNGVALDNRM